MINLSPKRAVAIVAHPDDIEYFCGGTLAKWIKNKCVVSYIVVSSGDKGSNDPHTDIEMLTKTREGEQSLSAEILGVNNVTFLRYPDGELSFVNHQTLRGEFVRHIRRTQAEVVLTHDPLVRLSKQHPDHRLVGQLTMDACFPISSVAQCNREQIIKEGLDVCQPDYLLMFGTDIPNHWENIEDTIDLKVRSLKAHVSQQAAFHGGIEERLRWKARKIGQVRGMSAAEEFLLVRTGPTLPEN